MTASLVAYPDCVGMLLYAGPEDGEALEMAFSKKKVEDRKAWLAQYTSGTFLDHSAENICYRDFVHKVGGCCQLL